MLQKERLEGRGERERERERESSRCLIDGWSLTRRDRKSEREYAAERGNSMARADRGALVARLLLNMEWLSCMVQVYDARVGYCFIV